MRPVFIAGAAGPLFAVYYPPVALPTGEGVVHVPAFAEEMNKSRRMVALQARALAEQGLAVLVVDLYGTGDSGGEFAEATWPLWLEDVEAAMAWLLAEGARTVTLWGLRVGVLLALATAARGAYPLRRLLAWQPVTCGELFVTQFLRLRVAAALQDAGAARESTAQLKQHLLSGHGVEVAGYQLNPELVRPLLALRAEQLPLPDGVEVAVFEVAMDMGGQLPPARSPWLDHLRAQASRPVAAYSTAGAPFWSSQEITEVPALLTQTSAHVAGFLG